MIRKVLYQLTTTNADRINYVVKYVLECGHEHSVGLLENYSTLSRPIRLNYVECLKCDKAEKLPNTVREALGI